MLAKEWQKRYTIQKLPAGADPVALHSRRHHTPSSQPTFTRLRTLHTSAYLPKSDQGALSLSLSKKWVAHSLQQTVVRCVGASARHVWVWRMCCSMLTVAYTPTSRNDVSFSRGCGCDTTAQSCAARLSQRNQEIRPTCRCSWPCRKEAMAEVDTKATRRHPRCKGQNKL